MVWPALGLQPAFLQQWQQALSWPLSSASWSANVAELSVSFLLEYQGLS